MTAGALLLLLNAAALGGASSPYNLVLINDSPITTGAQGLVEARLVSRAGGFLSPNSLAFHWDLRRPLSVVRRSEGALSCSLTVRSRSPGVYKLRAWVSRADCWGCPPLAHGSTTLHVTDSVMGTLSLTQLNESVTSSTNGYELATKTPTKISFLLYDPSGYFNTSLFHYSWHFGDGEKTITNDSYTFHVYPKAGIYQAHVDVFVFLSHSRRKTGVFGVTLSLLDSIKSIEVKSTDNLHASGIHDLHLHVNGSPPLKICWLLSQNCIPVVGHKCRPVQLDRSQDYNLSCTLGPPEPYTLNVRAENSVSALQTCYRITSWKSGIHPVWFIIPSVTLFTVVLLFILSTTMRSRRSLKDLVEVADFDFSTVGEKLVQERRTLSGKSFPSCCSSGLSLGSKSHSHSAREAHSLLKFSCTLPQDYHTWERHSVAPGTDRPPGYNNNVHLHSSSSNAVSKPDGFRASQWRSA
ncbi:transmembrane protein 130 [Pristis pectinata]|uniref:transmembrane protein 130 n=1 Tax=Pristis pectinata TaxID=685728 RepID=UPI00223CDB76|nr:transmembrane protein 130 [Pristis pectinata]